MSGSRGRRGRLLEGIEVAQVEDLALGLSSESIELGILVDGDDGRGEGGGRAHGGRRGTPVFSGVLIAVGIRVEGLVHGGEAKVVGAGSAGAAVGRRRPPWGQ